MSKDKTVYELTCHYTDNAEDALEPVTFHSEPEFADVVAAWGVLLEIAAEWGDEENGSVLPSQHG